MKKVVIASVATAALALAAPAFAQTTDTVQGTVTGQAEVQTAPSTATPPPVETTEEAAPLAEAATTTETPVATAEATTEAPTMSVEAETSTQVAAAPTTGASATTETSVEAAADLPQPVQVAVADGRYTTEDLNRAQLAALQAGPGR